jgi:hypothetical protein
MSWRTAAAVIIAVFALTVVWAIFADPLIQIADAFTDFDTSGQFNYEDTIDGLVGTWFKMILLAVFGILGWGTWRVLRKEITRGGI